MTSNLEYSVLRHKEVKAYDAIASLDQNEEVSTYTIQYPTLKRTLSIRFNNEFPYVIQSWEETHANGLKTTATLMKTIQLDYWSKHSVEDLPLRDSLKLGR